MTTIEEIELRLEIIRKDLAGLKKPKPCPLEDGVEVTLPTPSNYEILQRIAAGLNGQYDSPFHGASIQKEGETLTIRLKYSGEKPALIVGRRILNQFGGSD